MHLEINLVDKLTSPYGVLLSIITYTCLISSPFNGGRSASWQMLEGVLEPLESFLLVYFQVYKIE